MINVAVMFGGRSVEHDVSIISAVQAMEQFDPQKYTVYPIYITKNNEFYYGTQLRDIKSFHNIDELIDNCTRVVFTKDKGKVEMLCFSPAGIKKDVIAELDIAFPIVHGTNVEDGILQGFLKTLDIPFVGCDVLSSAVGMDKYVMKVLLRSEGFPVLEGAMFSKNMYPDYSDIVKQIEERFSYPVIVKPVNLGSSVGISKASDKVELEKAVDRALNFSTKILVEPAIVELKEVNCSVLGNARSCAASECEEPITSHAVLDFEEKYITGAKKTGGSKGMASLKRKIPADIDQCTREHIRDVSCRVFKYLECCGVVRLDFMIDKATDEVWLNEINTIPGSLSFYLWEAVGISYPQLLDKLIELAFDRYETEKQISYVFESSILDQMTAK